MCGIDLDVVLEFVEVGVGGRERACEGVHGVAVVILPGEAVECSVDGVEEFKTVGSILPVADARVGDDMERDLNIGLANTVREVLPVDIGEFDEDGWGVEGLFLLSVECLLVPEIDVLDDGVLVLVDNGEEGLLDLLIDYFSHGLSSFTGEWQQRLDN